MNIQDVKEIGEKLGQLSTADLNMLNHMYGEEVSNLVAVYTESSPLTLSDFQGDGEDLLLSISDNCGESGLFLDNDDVLQNSVNLLGGEADWTDILETLREDNRNVYDHFITSIKKYLKEEAENGDD